MATDHALPRSEKGSFSMHHNGVLFIQTILATVFFSPFSLEFKKSNNMCIAAITPSFHHLIKNSSAESLDAAASKPDPDLLQALTAEAARSGNIPALHYALHDLSVAPAPFILPAIANGRPEVTSCLLDAGLDVNYRIPGHTGTPLVSAALFAKIDLLRLLLARGADPNLDNCGHGQFQLRPLAAAADGWMLDSDAAEAMRVLLEEGRARWEGSAALQVAAKKGREECVRVLVGHGADVDEVVERVSGKRALALAKEAGFEKIVAYLTEKGARE